MWFTQKCATPSEFNGEENGVRYHDIKWCAVSRHNLRYCPIFEAKATKLGSEKSPDVNAEAIVPKNYG